jgi:hypothetical protein
LHCANSNSTVEKQKYFVVMVLLKLLRVFKPAGLTASLIDRE